MPFFNQSFIILFILLIFNSKQYIVLPIFTDNPVDNISLLITNTSEFLTKVFYNKLYTYIQIGNSKSKIYAYVSIQYPEFFLSNSKSLFPSFYSNYSSSSFKLSSKCENYIETNTEMCISNESFYFYKNFDFNKNIEMQNITFLYEINTKSNDNYPIMNIGLQLPQSEFLASMEGLIVQMKKKDYIESTYWTIEYNEEKIYGENNKTIDAFLIIGLPPHFYNSNKYKINNFRSAIADAKEIYVGEFISFWGIVFDDVFFFNNTNKISMNSKTILFDNTINVIIAPDDYLKNIEKFFFFDLYNKSQCFKEYTKLNKLYSYYVIWCKIESYKYIKNFPVLYMVTSKLEYKFELNYNDLFYVNNDKIYFMVVFDPMIRRFTLGKTFLKKHLFTFSFDNSLVGFYSGQNNEKDNTPNTKIAIIFCLLFVLIVLVILGVWIYKHKIDVDRQKRVNEISDDAYDYKAHDADEVIN